MPDLSRPPSSPPEPGASLASRIARAPYLKGLSELEMFPDDASRQRALGEIEKGFMPRSLREWGQFLLAVVVFLTGPAIVGYLIAHIALPRLGPWNARIFLGVMLLGYAIIVYLAIRRDMPKALRNSLLDLGIPVCVACGYDLRNLPRATVRCPECGRKLDGRAVRALAGAEP